MDISIDCNVFYLCSFIVKTSPNAQNCVSVLKVNNSFAIPCASKRYPVRRISLSTIMKRQRIKRIEVLAFVIAAALYACGLRPVSNYLSHNCDVIKLQQIIQTILSLNSLQINDLNAIFISYNIDIIMRLWFCLLYKIN